MVTCKESTWDNHPGKRETITRIELPPGIPVRVEGRIGELKGQGFDNPLVVDKHFGEIDLSNLAGSLTIRSDSGDVTVREVRGKTVIRLKNGQVKVEQVSDLQLALDSGGIRIMETSGSIDATVQGGSITLDNSKGLDGDCRLYTGAGTIEFSAGKLENCHLVASSGAGEVVVPLYLEKPENRNNTGAGQTLEATVGRGVKTIDLFARQGSVTVR